jgi:hypothetical protein
MDKFKKFIWIMIFAGALINGAALIMPEVPKEAKMKAALFGVFQCLYCYWMFDRVWPKKEEE